MLILRNIKLFWLVEKMSERNNQKKSFRELKNRKGKRETIKKDRHKKKPNKRTGEK